MAKRTTKKRVTKKKSATKKKRTTRRRKVRLALIGAGGMANSRHYPSLAENPAAEMVALCDLVPEKLEQTADKFGIERRYTDYRKMLDEVRCDAVYCLMPPHHLFDISAEVLCRGQNLFVEKPLAANAFQANSLARLAAENGCLTMVGFNRRFAPLVVMAKAAVDKRGGVRECRSVFHKNSAPYYYRGAIDSISCDAVHAVDLLRYMGGEVFEIETAVSTFPKKEPDPVPNAWISVVRFESGAVGTLSANWASGARWLYCEMHAPTVSALCEIENTLILKEDNDAVGRTVSAVELVGSEDGRLRGGYKQENDHFVECIRTGKQPQTNFADAARTMELADALTRGVL